MSTSSNKHLTRQERPERTGRKQGRWSKGQSGNPHGRPRGTRNKATLAAQALLDGEAEALTRVCIKRALKGESVALRLAQETGVAAVKRDVFLDPDHAPGTLEREFARLKKLARERGFAVGIGHPHPQTIQALGKLIVDLNKSNIKIIPLKQMLKFRKTGKVTWQKSSSPSPKVVKN